RGQHLPLYRLPEHRRRDRGGGTMTTTPSGLEVGQGIGVAVPRKEDQKLPQGQAQWVDNMRVPGMVYLALVRSPYAHARIVSVDVKAALAHADVVAAWSGEELAAEWAGSLPCAWLPTEDTNAPEHKPVAVDKARYAGDAVAVIAAMSRGAAEEAVEHGVADGRRRGAGVRAAAGREGSASGRCRSRGCSGGRRPAPP